jgi:hypothetical protein
MLCKLNICLAQAVPYIAPLKGGVSPGMLLSITGMPSPQCQWFAINLQCGTNVPRDDIALHITPRFEAQMARVVRNSLQVLLHCSC